MARVNPRPGLQNCLSAHHSHPTTAALAHHQTLLFRSPPPRHLSAAAHAVALPPARVHAVTADGTAVFVTARRVAVCTPRATFTSPHRLHFEERALAAAHRPAARRIDVVVAGYDGVLVTSLSLHSRTFAPLRHLPATSAHPVVCVAVHRRSVAAATLDGRVAVWRPFETARHACVVVAPAPALAAADRVTDIAFAPHAAFVVAWWSGAIVMHDNRGRVVWAMHSAPRRPTHFAATSATFLAAKPPYVVACRAGGEVLWIHVADSTFVSRQLPADVKGFCCAAGQLLLWDFETGLIPIPSPADPAFAASCKPICAATQPAHQQPQQQQQQQQQQQRHRTST